jgi:hypothetical protein
MLVDPRLERIAARLLTAELAAFPSGVHDDDDKPRFCGLYTLQGLHRVLHAYGVTRQLRAIGLGDAQLHLESSDAFHHRLHVCLPGGQTIMDLRMRLFEHHGEAVVGIDWLTMQHPLHTFTDDKPALPGQQHPGTGMARLVLQLLVLLARRLGRVALVTVPERWHLAVLYARAGFSPVDGSVAADLRDIGVMMLRSGLSFHAAAWALEQNQIVDDDGRAIGFRPGMMWMSTHDKAVLPIALPTLPPLRHLKHAARPT